ncbi:tRNA uridine(34) 5-carboxymethylaminomethyl modification radical SAM/GNAT enzyme Elp3 [Halobacteriales archaeon QH_2_66_30]|nr:MAG: tRNA uridine(34) 5-carboxymethylaminomethyl modification radical SAM/GNAT enzyme Elp3 [Halobacteriales archaeon QH_2_66_30]
MSTDSSDGEDAFESVCEELVDRILAGEIERDDLESAKTEVCGEYSSPKVPKNSELLDFAPDEHREELASVLQRKPVRTASGVSPIAIMTSPHRCPHGKCLYCPGGPDSEFSSAQSYTGHEPAAARGKQNDYDPYGQVTLRLHQLREIGHPVDKAELILMGGTMTARSHDYQEWFVKRALAAMNDYDVDGEPLGGTKVEVGVQTTYERINREMHRGHGTQDSIDANRRLRDSGFKVGFHMMPGQPGMSTEMCLEDFRRIFERPEYRPDYLKIYPTLVVEGTAVYDWWHEDEFEPLGNDEAAELVAEIKSMIPRYTRLQRVQRDIPADFIEGGVWKSNLRQLARKRMDEHGWTCDCIRCREVGHNDEEPEDVELDVMTYEVAGGTEQYISFEDFEKDLLVGFCRLRFPNDPVRRELSDAAVVRELHVYGSQVGVGEAAGTDEGESGDDPVGEHQHQGYGRRLLAEAERLAADAGYPKLAVLSGIGVREYYREKLGYRQDGPYVSKRIESIQ